MSEWNTGTEGMDMLDGSGLGGMNILSLGMNLGGGMNSAMSHDANMGMSDWALFDNNDNHHEPKFQQ